MRIECFFCAFTLLVAARVCFADLSTSFVQVPISAAAKVADPTGFLNNAQCWSLRATNTDGHWEQAGLRMTLPAGATFYNTVPGRGGQDTHPNPTFFPPFPDVEFDTYVSSPRNQSGNNAPAIIGAFPDTSQPHSMGGATDPLPGVLAVAWGDPAATLGPGPGTYEICRFTFPLGVVPTIDPLSQTSQVSPTRTIFIPTDIPEPAAAGLLSVVALALRRRSRAAK